MIDLSGIQQIQARIAEIEGEFNLKQQNLPGLDFASKLRQEIDKNTAAAASKAHAAQRVDGTKPVASPTHAEKAGKAELANPDLTQMIHQAAQKYHVDPKLVSAVAEVESGGHQDAVSPAGAVGVMQLMPETAVGLGVDPYSAEGNVEGGAKYLSELMNTFGGDVKKAVAAYNAGPNAVKAYGGVPPYAETQDYVNRVLDIYR